MGRLFLHAPSDGRESNLFSDMDFNASLPL